MYALTPVTDKVFPVVFPPAEVQAFADTKIATEVKAEVDAGNAAVGAGDVEGGFWNKAVRHVGNAAVAVFNATAEELAAKAKAEAEGKAKADVEAKAKADTEAKAKADAKAKAAADALKAAADSAAISEGYSSAEDKKVKEAAAAKRAADLKALADAKTAAQAELERKVHEAVQRQIESNSIRSKINDLSKSHFKKMDIKEYLIAQHLNDDGWFEKLMQIRSLLPERRAEYEAANNACTKLEAEHTLAQAKHDEMKSISDSLKSQFDKASFADCDAVILLRNAQKDLSKCQSAEKQFNSAVSTRKCLGIAALILVATAFIVENFIAASNKSVSFMPSASIEILIASFHIDEFYLRFFRLAASAVFILAFTLVFWGLLPAFRTAKGSSDFTSLMLTAAAAVDKAAASRDSLKLQADRASEAYSLAKKRKILLLKL